MSSFLWIAVIIALFLWIAVIIALFQQEKGKQLKNKILKKKKKEKKLKKPPYQHYLCLRTLLLLFIYLSQQAKVPVRACGTMPIPEYSDC